MASQKHLKDLLQEDQEPFHLKSYITDLKIRTRKSVTKDAKLGSNFCRNACFLSFNQSPDPRKSPLFGFQSPNKSPNSFLNNIPSRTAAALLEAAARIQKRYDPVTKTQNRGNAFGLFGSMLKKLKHMRKREIRDVSVGASVKDILTWDSPVVNESFSGDFKGEKFETAFETRLSCFCNKEASCLETSTDSESDGLDEMDELACETMDGVDLSDNETQFCESPFLFVLQKSSPDFRTPNFLSPAASPSRRRTENKENYEVKSLKTFQAEEEDEEDKEQCSPVSVLETPFEDDDDDDDDGGLEEDDEEQRFHLKRHSIARRSKCWQLQKLSRFEELAMDSVELVQRISEQEHYNYTSDQNEQDKQDSETKILVQTIIESACNEANRISEGMKRLVYDLVAEEEEEEHQESRDTVAKRVCRRLDSWKEVELNTIDMMVEQNFRQELHLWSKNREEVEETAMEIDLAILGYLIDELFDDFELF